MTREPSNANEPVALTPRPGLFRGLLVGFLVWLGLIWLMWLTARS